jgi:hypothetical protein
MANELGFPDNYDYKGTQEQRIADLQRRGYGNNTIQKWNKYYEDKATAIRVDAIIQERLKVANRKNKAISVFTTKEKNIVPEIVKPVSRTNKPVSIFNQNDFSQNQTSIADLSSELETFIDSPIFKNDETEIKNVSYQVTPSNFKVVNGRITGTVNVSSSELTNEKTVLHASFYPLHLKQNKLGEKMNQLNFNKDLNETIQINESSKNYENISMNLHVMNPKTKEHLSQEVNIDVEKSDSQDMPEKDKKDNTSMYVVAGIGLVALALILKKVRKGDKN